MDLIEILHTIRKNYSDSGAPQFIYLGRIRFRGQNTPKLCLVFSEWDEFKAYTRAAEEAHKAFSDNNISDLLVTLPRESSDKLIIVREKKQIRSIGKQIWQLSRDKSSPAAKQTYINMMIEIFTKKLKFIGIVVLDGSPGVITPIGEILGSSSGSKFKSVTIPEIFVDFLYVLGFSGLVGENLCSYDMEHIFFSGPDMKMTMIPRGTAKKNEAPVSFEMFKSIATNLPFAAPETLLYGTYTSESEVFCACSVIMELLYRAGSSNQGWYVQYEIPESFFSDFVGVILEGRTYGENWNESDRSMICDPRIKEYTLRKIAQYLFNLTVIFGNPKVPEMDPLNKALDDIAIFGDVIDVRSPDGVNLSPSQFVGNKLSTLLDQYMIISAMTKEARDRNPLAFLSGVPTNLVDNLVFGLRMDPFKRLEPISVLVSQKYFSEKRLDFPRFLLNKEIDPDFGHAVNTVSVGDKKILKPDHPVASRVFRCLTSSNGDCLRAYLTLVTNQQIEEALKKALGVYYDTIPHIPLSDGSDDGNLLTQHTLNSVYNFSKSRN